MQYIIWMIYYLLLYIAVYHPDDMLHLDDILHPDDILHLNDILHPDVAINSISSG